MESTSKNENTGFKIPLFWIMTSLYWFSLYAYMPNLSPYAQQLGASHKWIGLIVGAYGFTQMIIRIPLGICSDTFNKRKIFIVFGFIVSIISSIVVWIFPSPTTLLIARALSGVAAATWVAFTVLFSSYFKEKEAPKAIGYINSSNGFGQMVAIFSGGMVAQVLGTRHAFLLAAIGGMVGLAVSLWIKDNKTIDRQPLKIADIWEIALEKQLLLVSVLAIFSQFVTFATVFGFTPVVANMLGANEFEQGLISTFSIVPGIVSAAMSGTYFANTFGKRNTLVIGFIVTALTCIYIPLVSSLYMLYIVQFIGGFARGMVFSLLMGMSIETVNMHKRATAMGFFQAIYGLGMFVGPSLVGVLSDVVSLHWGFWLTALVGFMGSGLSFCVALPEHFKQGMGA